jgi:hypothetical protein
LKELQQTAIKLYLARILAKPGELARHDVLTLINLTLNNGDGPVFMTYKFMPFTCMLGVDLSCFSIAPRLEGMMLTPSGYQAVAEECLV